MPSYRYTARDAAGQLVPGPVLNPEESIENPALIDTFHTALRSNEVVFGEKGRPGDVTIRLGTERVPPPNATLVTWTLDAESPFYCVEPWMGPANAAEHKVGLHFVAPGATDKFTVRVSVK